VSGVELASVVRQLRAELNEALADAQGERLRFELGPVQVSLSVTVDREGGAGAKVRFWVIEAGADARVSREAVQEIKLVPRLCWARVSPASAALVSQLRASASSGGPSAPSSSSPRPNCASVFRASAALVSQLWASASSGGSSVVASSTPSLTWAPVFPASAALVLGGARRAGGWNARLEHLGEMLVGWLGQDDALKAMVLLVASDKGSTP